MNAANPEKRFDSEKLPPITPEKLAQMMGPKVALPPQPKGRAK